jgi:hypothetical protein
MNAILNSSSAMAIDGHAIASCSDENDLGETGYKCKRLIMRMGKIRIMSDTLRNSKNS